MMRSLLFLLSLPISSFSQSWVQLADFSETARDDGSSFVIGNKAYCLTGLEVGWQCTRDGSAFDYTTETWSAFSSLPAGQERQYATAWANDSVGYLLGGINCSGNCLNDFWKYNPIIDTWTSLPNFPGTGRYGMSNFVLNNKVYVLGGKLCDGTFLNELWEYDPVNSQWTQKNSLPTAIWRGASFTIDSLGYVCFGMNSDSTYNHFIYRYDPPNDNWSQVPNHYLPARKYVGTAVCSNRACLYGGEDSLNTVTNTFLLFDPADTSLTSLPGIPTIGRKGGMTFSFNNTFYITTGLDSTQNRIKETWKYTGLVNVNEHDNEENISLYPNPASDIINIKITSDKLITNDDFEVRVSNFVGKNIFRKKIGFSDQLDCNMLASGVYYLTVYRENKILAGKKIVIIK